MATTKKKSKRKLVQVLHPGEILRNKLAEKKITQKAFAHLIDMQPPHVSGLINGKRHVSAMLALKLEKPILSLTNSDYNDNALSDLLVEKGDAYEINLQVFYQMRDSITGWPGGKPNVHNPAHAERSLPYPKRVVIFSPHPDDDIISMGGSFMRLHDQGHDVHVAYQTSGNIAVTDEFVRSTRPPVSEPVLP